MNKRMWHGVVTLCVLLALAGPVVGSARGGESQPAPNASLGGWVTETVDSAGNVGLHCAVALDSAGLPHLSYYDTLNGDLRYATFDGTAWLTATVDSTGDVGQYTSLKVDAQGYSHISYYYATSGDLKYAYQDGAGWHVETVDPTNMTGRYTSLSLDASGYPHIAYESVTGLALRYAYKDGGGWHLESPPATGAVYRTALVLDGSGYPHVAYYDGTGLDIYYGYRDGTGWHFEIAVNSNVMLVGPALALDASGVSHLAYGGIVAGANQVNHTYKDPGLGWQTEAVESNSNPSNMFSLAVDAAGRLHLSYDLGGALRYGERSASGWRLFTVDTSNMGQYNGIAVDAGHQPHIAYWDAANNDLKYAGLDAVWYTEMVAAGVGNYVSLRFDQYNRPRICFYDADNQDLVYGRRDAAGWSIEPVDTTWDVGQYCSLALDASGYPHISYYYATEGDLRYAYKDASGWHIENVDASPSPIAGKWTSLALDAQGYPHISYFHETYSTLRYAYKDGTGWHIETVPCGSQCGRYTSLALDPTTKSRPRISFQLPLSPGSLHYAARSPAGTWTLEKAYEDPVTTPTGLYTSLRMGATDLPYIAFARGGMAGDLLFSYKDGFGSWNTTLVDNPSLGVTGLWNTLVLDAAQHPHIVTLDQTAGELRYAWQGGTNGTTWYTMPLGDVGTDGGYCSLEVDSQDYLGVAYYNANAPQVEYTYNNCLSVAVAPNPPACVDTAIAFDNLSFGALPVGWDWSFGDGLTSTVAYPSHTYSLAGAYVVTLAAANSCGSGEVTVTQIISSTPTAVFTYDAPACAGEVLPFYNTSAGSATLTYAWTFGDGGYSTEISPTHTYATPGNYECYLLATNGCGQDTEHQTVVAHGGPAVAPAWSPMTPTMGYPVDFTVNQTSTLPLTCSWDFGDGTQAGPAACGPTTPITHTYVATGTYTVVVTATDDCGTDVAWDRLVVVAMPHAGFLSNAPVCLGQPVEFTNTSGGGEPLSFQWAFGDGNTSTAKDPTHTYALPGDYLVVLTVTNPYGQDATSQSTAVWTGVTEADFAWAPFSPAPGAVVTFTAAASGTAPITYEWDLGDGFTATGAVITHVYAVTDVYTVTMTAANACGNQQVVQAVDVAYCAGPSGLQMAHSPTAPIAGEVVYFTATVTAGSEPLTWAWDFGDGTPNGAGATVTHTYAAGGTYTVATAVWNSCGYTGPLNVELVVGNATYYVYLPVVLKSYCPGDAFEPDNTASQAKSLVLGVAQDHNFTPENDEDWTRLTLTAGQTYRFWTSDLAGSADTRLFLYQQGQYGTPVAENDDWAAGNCGGTPADPKQSCFTYVPGTSGVYELKVNQYLGGAQWGCHVQYTLQATQQ